ncbi:MAG: dihydrofolate reductase [Flavobacteriales bacterium]|nr:dihydrofolate reductase [Flavobacteriales bacterium]
MKISIIVAAGENGEIGKDNQLLWHLPTDMKFFKRKTTGHHVLMGRNSYESIPEKYRPLPNRVNIVVSRNINYEASGCVIKHSIEEAIEVARNANETELFVIGGGQIYKYFMERNLVDVLYLTRVHNSFDADTFFPLEEIKGRLDMITHISSDDKHQFSFSFEKYLNH